MAESAKKHDAETAAGKGVPALPELALQPRDERFAVIVSGRPSRAGHTPFQIAIPQELHHRLRYECLGSTNQVMVALVRQALRWLDAENLTLRADPHPGPPPRSLEEARAIPETVTGTMRRDFERTLDRLWPNARLSTGPRQDHRVVVQHERQPRVDALVTQIALPAQVQRRLVRDGIGAASQLVISLARYALHRLDEDNLTLEVVSTDGKAKPSAATTSASDQPSVLPAPGDASTLTVAQLIGVLSKLPPDALVVFEEGSDRWWDIQKAQLSYLGVDNPYADGLGLWNALDAETPLVTLSGEHSEVYELSEDEPGPDDG